MSTPVAPARLNAINVSRISALRSPALDAAAADRLRADLSARLAAGLGLVVVTHRLAEVWGLATRVAVLAEGRWACDERRDGALEAFLPRFHGLVGA